MVPIPTEDWSYCYCVEEGRYYCDSWRNRCGDSMMECGDEDCELRIVCSPAAGVTEEDRTCGGSGSLVMAGPTNPLSSKRVQTLKPTKFSEEPLNLECEWESCSLRTRYMAEFMEHVAAHVPFVQVFVGGGGGGGIQVYLNCNWRECPWKTESTCYEDLQRHLYLHAYHTKLKCIGLNTIGRSDLNPCGADTQNRNILPDLSENLLCAWSECCQQFTNIQLYYNHIRAHVDDTPKGKNVPGGIRCRWSGCECVYPNATKLRDHMRSHTQEKLLACPTCGGLFANRTRFFDHCRRQVLLEDGQSYGCEVCMKCFSTARLLRDHIRSHVNTYRCSECEMSCSSPSALSNHLRYRHSLQKPFSCELCEYASKSVGDLNRHAAKVHSSTVYKCEEDEDCAFHSKSYASLTAHWKKVHQGGVTGTGSAEAAVGVSKKYACHECDKLFLKGYYLTKHLIAVHKLQWPAGHTRFRYKMSSDGFYRLLTVRYEISVEEQQQESATATAV